MMAIRLIKQQELETLFPNEIQRKAFLDIMSGLIMVDPEERVAETIFETDKIVIQKVYKGYCLWFEGEKIAQIEIF